MILESVGFIARRDKTKELQAGLSFLLGPTRVESGCVGCHLYQEVANPNCFRFESVWTTQADFIRHLRSDNYRQVLILMELSSEPPDVQFHTISDTHGLELVHATRQQQIR